MKKIFTSFLTLLVLGLFLAVSVAPVFADPTPTTDGSHTPSTDGSNTPSADGSNTKNTNTVKLTISNPFKKGVGNNLYDLVKAIINNIVMPVGGVLCVLAFIYSGFMYVSARGDQKKIETAHNALLYTAVGTALLLGAWVFANVIQNTVKQLM